MMGVYRWIVGVLLGLLLGVGGSWFTDLRKAVQRDEVTIMIETNPKVVRAADGIDQLLVGQKELRDMVSRLNDNQIRVIGKIGMK